jgi:hypothetical protein
MQLDAWGKVGILMGVVLQQVKVGWGKLKHMNFALGTDLMGEVESCIPPATATVYDDVTRLHTDHGGGHPETVLLKEKGVHHVQAMCPELHRVAMSGEIKII